MLLTQALMQIISSSQQIEDMRKCLNSCLMLDSVNGIGRRRRVRLGQSQSGRKTGDVFSAVLSNTALEFLVHRHIIGNTKEHQFKALSLPRFIEILRDRYGFHIDRAPPDLPVPNELLQRNRRYLERRLRDLGLLVGVNDAESMKRLRQRFPAVPDERATT